MRGGGMGWELKYILKKKIASGFTTLIIQKSKFQNISESNRGRGSVISWFKI